MLQYIILDYYSRRIVILQLTFICGKKKKCKIYLLFYFFFFFIISVLHQWTETIVDIIKGAQSKSAFISKSNSIFKNLAERIKAI